jgi:hypothetical protein
MLLTNGVDPKTIAGRAGHSNASVTLEVYSHFLKTVDKKATDRIDTILDLSRPVPELLPVPMDGEYGNDFNLSELIPRSLLR